MLLVTSLRRLEAVNPGADVRELLAVRLHGNVRRGVDAYGHAGRLRVRLDEASHLVQQRLPNIAAIVEHAVATFGRLLIRIQSLDSGRGARHRAKTEPRSERCG